MLGSSLSKRIAPLAFLPIALLVASPGSARASEWELDPAHSSVAFSVRHMMVSTVRGAFTKVSGTAKVDDADPTRSTIAVTIQVDSIDTREAKRDAHLKAPDFFDAAKYPTIEFRSTKIEPGAGGAFKLTGDLTIRGVTKSVTLDVPAPSDAVKTPFGTTIRGASATAKINRKDFGLTWNKALETGGVVVGEEVDIQIDAEFIRKG